MNEEEDILTKPFLVEKELLNVKNGMIQHEPPMDFGYIDCSERYILQPEDKEKFYTRQYFHYYRLKFRHLYPRILKHAQEIVGPSVQPITFSEVRKGEKVLVIGCVLKKVKNRIPVVKDLGNEDDEQVEIRIQREEDEETFASDEDIVDLEDFYKQSVTLKGNFDPYDFVTGMVIGVYGSQAVQNIFDIEHVIMPTLPLYIERPLLEKDVYVIFASGFNIKNPNSSLFRELNYFAEIFASKKYYGNIARMIFAGNSAITFCQCALCQRTNINNVQPIGQTLDADKSNCALAASNAFRRYFPYLDVDIMPGELDPASMMLPQPPLNKVLLEDYDFPENDEEHEDKKLQTKGKADSKVETIKVKAKDLDSTADEYWMASISGLNPGHKRALNPVTNPYSFKVMGVAIHGTSGQNVSSFRRMTAKDRTTLYIMKKIIECGHIVPTAPDFTDCFPYARNNGIDPLALDDLPNIFFAGNQKEYATDLVDFGKNRKVRLVSIPKFEDSHSMVVINLRTLETSRIVSSKKYKDDL